MTRALIVCAALVAGCGDDIETFDAGGDFAMAAGADLSTAFPPPPPLGKQIDRMGRPAINTAITDPFYLADPSSDGMSEPNTDVEKDQYNADGDTATWAATWAPKFEPNLALLDALDGVCGNQFLASGAGADAGSSRYLALAGALADDELYVDTARTDCDSPLNYLAVEARAVIASQVPGCGGRTPLDDTIDTSYTLLGEGTDFLPPVSAPPITDGVNADADGNASSSAFPFLGVPN